MFRTLTITLVATLALPLLAEEDAPPELRALTATYEKEHAKLIDAYTGRLQTLRKSFERSQKLYEAALVHEAIKAAEASRPSGGPPPPKLKTFPAQDIQILTAVWGLSHRRVDITERVAQALDNNEPFEVSRDTVGDPFPYKAKDVVVVYLHGGQLHTYALEGNNVLTYKRITEAREKKQDP